MKNIITTIKTFATFKTFRINPNSPNSLKSPKSPKVFRKGFSLVELIVVIVIIGILSGAAYIGIQKVKSKNMNDKVLDDLIAISNAMEQYKRDHFGSYRVPVAGVDNNMNLNCFYADATYAHDCTPTGGASFIQGMIDNNLLTKRYLQEVPTDPRTGSRYVYGVTVDGKYFQVAGLYENSDGTWSAKVVGNVAKGFHLPSLIRAYNGPNFVVEDGTNLPYSPDYMTLTGTLNNINMGGGSDNVTVNSATATDGMIVQTGDKIITSAGATADIYFSDGSVTHLAAGTELDIQSGTEVTENNKDSIITKIRLKLFSGKIWNKVARLAARSEFNVETTSAIAGVRGTEFGMDSNQILLYKGDVCKLNIPPADSIIAVEDIKDCSGNYKIGEMTVEATDAPILQDAATTLVTVPLAPESNEGLKALMDSQTKHYLNDNMSPHILSVTAGGVVTIQNIKSYYGVDQTIQVNKIAAYISPYTVGAASVVSADITPDSADDYQLTIPSSQLGQTFVFRFEDTANNLVSGFSEPSIAINATTAMTAADIYGLEGEVAGGLPPEGTCDTTSADLTAIVASPDMLATITWTGAPPCAFASSFYNIYFGSTTAPIATNVSGPTYQVTTPLTAGTTYFWKVEETVLGKSAQDNFTAPIGTYCGDGHIQSPNDEHVNEVCDNGANNKATNYCEYGLISCSTVCSMQCTFLEGTTSYCGDSHVDTTNGEKCETSDVGCTTTCACNQDNYFVAKAGGGCECISGYHSTGTSCVLDECTYGVTLNQTQNCPITNGKGKQTRACVTGNVWGAWSDCSVQSCDTGYEISGNLCKPTLQTTCVGLTGNTPVTAGATTIGYKNTTMGTYYSLADGGCWVLGVAGQSCDVACENILDPLNLIAPSSCVAGNWNVDTNICTALKPTFSLGAEAYQSYAPYVTSSCIPRKTDTCVSPYNYTDCPNQTCSASSPMARICKCS